MPDSTLKRVTKSMIYTDSAGKRHESIVYVRFHTRKSDVTQILNMTKYQNQHPVGTAHYVVVVEAAPMPDFEQVDREG